MPPIGKCIFKVYTFKRYVNTPYKNYFAPDARRAGRSKATNKHFKLHLTGGYLRRGASPWEQTRGIRRGFAGERHVGSARGLAR